MNTVSSTSVKRFIDVGTGTPIVLIPGIQGRWEYLQPAIDALVTSFRVLTFPLSGEPECRFRLDPALGFDNDARQVLATLDAAAVDRAVVCGVSFGGLAAIRFAATCPDRTSALVLVSTPGPEWRLRPRHRVYSTLPRLFGPVFLLESPFRLAREIAAALPDWRTRGRFVRRQLAALVAARLSPARMAARAALLASTDIVSDCARVSAPTLIITGERDLDRVVSVERTLDYLRLIPGARHLTLKQTGHLGSITAPLRFACLVRTFTSLVLHTSNGDTSDAA